jgi:hypothetical protein
MCILLIPLILYILLMNSSTYVIFILVSGTTVLANVGRIFGIQYGYFLRGSHCCILRNIHISFVLLIVGTSVNNLNSY